MRSSRIWRKGAKRALALALAAVLAAGTGLGASAMDVRAADETVILEENSLLPEEEVTLTEEVPEEAGAAGEDLTDDSGVQTDLPVAEEEPTPQELPEEPSEIPEEVTLTEEVPEEAGAAGEDLIDDSGAQTDLPVAEEEPTPQELPEEPSEIPEEEVTLTEEQSEIPEEEVTLTEEPSEIPEEEVTLPGEPSEIPEEILPEEVTLPEELSGQPEDTVLSETALNGTNHHGIEVLPYYQLGFPQTAGTQIVHFAGNPWYVIGYDKKGVMAGDKEMTLFSKNILGKSAFNPLTGGDCNDFATNPNAPGRPSMLKAAMENLFNGSGAIFSRKEQKAVNECLLRVREFTTEDTPGGSGVSGTETKAYLWPLSGRDTYIIRQYKNMIMASESNWWLCSPGNEEQSVAYIRQDGVQNRYGTKVNNQYGLRPAFNLNLKSVVLCSASLPKPGKVSTSPGVDTLKRVSNSYGDEWKLTLLDDGTEHAVGSGHAGFRAWRTDAAWGPDSVCPGDQIKLSYENAQRGKKEYVSVILKLEPGQICFYGHLANDSTSGKDVALKIPETTAPGNYRLGIFAEERNDHKETDYSSAVTWIDLEVVKRINVTGISLNRNTLSMTTGEYGYLTATVTPENATNRNFTWESSNEAVATVTWPGLVEAVGEGEATITAKTMDGGLTASCKVTVQNAEIPVTGVALNKTSLALTAGKTGQLTATVIPSNATVKRVTWKSSNTAVATVSGIGLVKGVKAGTAVITVTSANGKKTATCKVTVTAGSSGGTGGGTTKPKTPDELTKEFITRAYREILGRTPDTSGMNYWFGELKAKRLGGGMMVAQFLNSREFINKKYNSGKTMDIMYRVYMNRTPEESGKKFWMDYLDGGLSVIYVAKGFTASAEFQNICKSYGIDPGTVALTQNRDKNEKVTRFVSRCYKESLGRNGEESGLNYWTGELLAKRITPAKVAEQFVFSKEMNSKGYDNSRFIQMLYRLCMGRKYDQAGLNYWLGQMGKGMTRQQVFSSFVNSREFQNIVKSYGL